MHDLSLSGMDKVTDAGLKHLAALENLEAINLFGVLVRDGGLVHLALLKFLQVLCLNLTSMMDPTPEPAVALAFECLSNQQRAEALGHHQGLAQPASVVYLSDRHRAHGAGLS